MGTTADKLNKLLNTKQAIKQAIIDKGVDVSDDTKFADYPAKINSIESGGSGTGGSGTGDPFYETMWNAITNNNTDYSYLFHKYGGTTLDISKLDTSNVTSMANMFNICFGLTSLDLSSFDTSNVIDMQYMFNICFGLTSLDLSNFDTSNVLNMNYMFYDCKKLTSLDLSSFDTKEVMNMNYMFYDCKKLTSLDLSHFDTSNVIGMQYVFCGCQSLTTLDMSNCDVSKCTSFSSTFGSSSSSGCIALTDFKAPKNIGANMNFSYCPSLSHDSLMSIINNLKTVTSTKTFTLGTTNLAKLTDEEKAIATGKGWTLK